MRPEVGRGGHDSTGAGGAALVERARGPEGLEEVVLRGDHLTLGLLPEAGGKILSLVDNASGFDLLWQNPRVPPSRTYAGAPFDDVWCGGWDDMFPTDVACSLGDNTFHDHGDLWIAPWSCDVEEETAEQATVRLSRLSVSLPCRVDKWITLARASNELRIRLRLTNLGTSPVRFIWNQHIAHAIDPGSRLHLPASRLGVVGTPGSLDGAGTVTWPEWRGTDLSTMPGADADVVEFLYAHDLGAGWCAVTHPDRGIAVRMTFDAQVFPTPWLWRVFGGWRGHHLLLTELCTSLPGSLAGAVANSSAASLEGGAVLETEIGLVVTADFDPSAPGDRDPLAS